MTRFGDHPAPERDRYFDLLRAVAIVRVVAFHMFPVAWLSMVFPAMGVMFALGGSLMACSVDRSAEQAITGRLRRLLPALWIMAMALLPIMTMVSWPDRPGWLSLLLWAFPIAQPPGPEWAEPVTGVLWYPVTYLWLVLLSPAALRLYRRARLATVLLPLVLLAAMDWIPWFLSDTAGSVVTDVLTFGACWFLGFAHRDGDLRRAPVAGLLTVADRHGDALAWMLTHPGEDGIDLASAPLAYGIYSIGFVLVLLRFPLPVHWLARHRFANGFVNVVNARAVTIYLWHNVAITVSFFVGDYLQVWRLGGLRMWPPAVPSACCHGSASRQADRGPSPRAGLVPSPDVRRAGVSPRARHRRPHSGSAGARQAHGKGGRVAHPGAGGAGPGTAGWRFVRISGWSVWVPLRHRSMSEPGADNSTRKALVTTHGRECIPPLPGGGSPDLFRCLPGACWLGGPPTSTSPSGPGAAKALIFNWPRGDQPKAGLDETGAEIVEPMTTNLRRVLCEGQ